MVSSDSYLRNIQLKKDGDKIIDNYMFVNTLCFSSSLPPSYINLRAPAQIQKHIETNWGNVVNKDWSDQNGGSSAPVCSRVNKTD